MILQREQNAANDASKLMVDLQNLLCSLLWIADLAVNSCQ